MRHGSLFSGIGGFDLAAEWAGWENIFHCEWNEFGKTILKHYWPNAISYHDITKTDFTIHRGSIDILTGGFPCQPYSQAGKRLGKEDSRHLWPEMLRAIREIQPQWVVGENVFGITNWNGGVVFNEAQADLEAEGYEVQPYVLPACAVNAPHRRDRVWFVAYRSCARFTRSEVRGSVKEYDRINGHGTKRITTDTDLGTTRTPRTSGSTESDRRKNNDEQEQWGSTTEQRTGPHEFLRTITDTASDGHTDGHTPTGRTHRSSEKRRLQQFEGESNDVANTCNQGLEGRKVNGSVNGSWEKPHQQPPGFIRSNWQNFPTQSPVYSGNDGILTRLDGITFPKWRNESIKAAGNAIVPQVALQIFKAINEYEKTAI